MQENNQALPKVKRITLSLAAARILAPVVIDPMMAAQMVMANKLMQQMSTKTKDNK